jgi:toxin-antitoxin system PIN domain toxin
LCLSGFLRVVTHPKVFAQPSRLDYALTFVDQIRSGPAYVELQPGSRHFSLFVDLCRKAGARGNLVPDAFLAALAIEAGAEWITTDKDYARFSGLRWRHPLEATR